MLAIDGTDIPKDGTESVGMARPYCGQLGQRANCQAAVCAAYLGRGAAALVDQWLYLSRTWMVLVVGVVYRKHTLPAAWHIMAARARGS